MKRLHLHVAVEDLDRSITFYETLFGTGPSVRKDDYAKWMLDDPHVNFAISNRGLKAGLDHLGIQADTVEELAEIHTRLKAAGEATRDQVGATCCYARSDKSWVNDPAGMSWETFHTFGEATAYGPDERPETASACCAAKIVAGEPLDEAAACC